MSGEKQGDELTGKFDISGAGLKETKKVAVEEKKEEKEKNDEEEVVEEREENEKETIKFSETKNTSEDEDEVEINFNSESEVNKFTSSKTKESQNKSGEKHFGNEKLEDIQKEISEAEKKANEIDPETFYDVADFIMTLLDSSLASGLKWWTKDSSESAYSLPKPKKEKLTKQLAKILIKYNAKFSIELMFIIGLIIMYIPAFRLARQRKKEIEELEIKNSQIKIPVIKQPTQQTSYTEKVVENVTVAKDEVHEAEVLEVIKPAKKRAMQRPRKA